MLFYEKRRKKAGAGLGWFGTGRTEEDIVWEKWSLQVTLATPRTEDGKFCRTIRSWAASDQNTRAQQGSQGRRVFVAEDHNQHHQHRQQE